MFTPSYFSGLTPKELESLYLQTLNLAESYLGANRKLGITHYSEMRNIRNQGFIQLNYSPLIISEAYPFFIRKRDLEIGNNWKNLIEIEDYEIDYTLNQVYLNTSYDRGFNTYRTRHFNTSRLNTICNINYYSGFNLDSPSSSEETSIHNALVALASYLNSDGVKQAMKKFKLDRHYEVEYSGGNDLIQMFSTLGKSITILNTLLLPFQKFRPLLIGTT